MVEVELVSGGGGDQASSTIWDRLEELGDTVANAVDVNNDGDVFDEVALGAAVAAGGAAYLGAAPVALTFVVIAGGAAYLDQTG